MISVKKQNDVRLLSFVDDVEQIIRETLELQELQDALLETPVDVRITDSQKQLEYGIITITAQFRTSNGAFEMIHLIVMTDHENPDGGLTYIILNGSNSGFDPLFYKTNTMERDTVMNTYYRSIVLSTIQRTIRKHSRREAFLHGHSK